MKLEITEDGSLYIGHDRGNVIVYRRVAEAVSKLVATNEGRRHLAHFAEHGTLPPAAPVWPGATVTGNHAEGWSFLNSGAIAFASCRRREGKWVANRGGWEGVGDTPQAAVDALSAEIRAFYCLG